MTDTQTEAATAEGQAAPPPVSAYKGFNPDMTCRGFLLQPAGREGRGRMNAEQIDQHAAYQAARNRLSGVAMVLVAAEAEGLGCPSVVDTATDSVGLHLPDAQTWLAWVRWIGSGPGSLVDTTTHVRWASDGQMFEQALRLLFLDPITCPRCHDNAAAHVSIGCGANKGFGATCRCPRSGTGIVSEVMRAAREQHRLLTANLSTRVSA